MSEHNEHKPHEHKTHEHHEKKEHHVHEAHHAKKDSFKMKKTTIWQAISAVLLIGLFIAIYFAIQTPASAANTGGITKEKAGEAALSFINNNLVQPGTEVNIKKISEENGMYKLNIDVAGSEVDSYISKDGSLFFPSAMNITEVEEQKEEAEKQAEEANADTPTKSKPEVEVFVMSHCPYGTQMEKGIIPVMETLGDKADIQIKFVNYAMHGEVEVLEQLNQYCIQKDFSSKYLDYLKCFLAEGDGASCLAEVGLSEAKLKSCVDATDEEFKIMENLNDESQTNWKGRFPPFDTHATENEKYGVRGSPHLVINGKTVSSARNPAALLAAVCAGFEDAPEECDTELSSENPAPGFGFDATGSATAATCG